MILEMKETHLAQFRQEREVGGVGESSNEFEGTSEHDAAVHAAGVAHGTRLMSAQNAHPACLPSLVHTRQFDFQIWKGGWGDEG